MQRVAAATGNDAGTRPKPWLPRDVHRHTLVLARDGDDARAAYELGAGPNRVIGEPLIEHRAVDDHGLDHASAVNDLLT
jgi:hypothetical protein